MKKMRLYLALTVVSVLFASNKVNAQILVGNEERERSELNSTNRSDRECVRILPVPASLIVIILEKLLSNSTIVNLLLGLSEKALEKLIEDLISHAQSHVDCPPAAPADQLQASLFHLTHQIMPDVAQK
ncbi:hypothetical protein HYX58_02935 [Candidatus Dependentiae bacterium]|nr:hypothetical protein [Candidatus Dependentiae bacterium]